MHLNTGKIHWNRAETNLNLGILPLQFWGIPRQVWNSATSNTAMWCTLPPSPRPLKRQWKPCVVLGKKKSKQKQDYQVCDFTEWLVHLQELIWSLLKSRAVLKPSIVTALPGMCINDWYFLEELCTLVCWRYLKTISWKKTHIANAQKIPKTSKQSKNPTKNSQLKRHSAKKPKPLTPSFPARVFNLCFSHLKVRNKLVISQGEGPQQEPRII